LTNQSFFEIILIETIKKGFKLSKQQLYKIIRFFRESAHLSKIIKRNLTLDEAQAHCRNPLTAKEGEWFDGYESQ